MASENPASRAIINENQPESRIPLLGWRQSDSLFVVVTGLLFYFVASAQIGEGWFPLIIGVIGAFLAGLVIYAKPSGYSIVDATTIGIEYLLQPNIMFSASKDADSEAKNKGGLLNKSPFKQFRPAARTQDLTNIKRAFPGKDAVLSKDGRMERIIEIEGENMDFAQPSVWGERQDIGTRFADENVSDRIKFYITTRDFEFDEIVNRLEKRLEDHDIKQAPVAEATLEHYRKNRPEELQSRGTQHVKTYICISISKSDVSTGYTDEQTPGEKLGNIPLVSHIVQRFIDTENEDGEESRTTNEIMIDKLDQLTTKVKEELIEETEGYGARQLTTVEMVVLLAQIYNDRDMRPERVSSAIGDSTTGAVEDSSAGEGNIADARRGEL